jgi:mRNA interferase RelE/StbE
MNRVPAWKISPCSNPMTTPHEYGHPLWKNLGGHWKLRVGDCRVVFKVVGKMGYVLGIRHRKSIYEDVTGRIK